MCHLRKPLLIGVTSWNYCLTYNEDLKHLSGAGLRLQDQGLGAQK